MLSDVGWAPTSITSPGKDTGDDGIPENSLPILHKSTIACYLSLIKPFAHPKKKSILLKWQVFLVQTARRCHPVERKTLHYKALSFLVMMENHFCTCIFNQKDLFPSPYPLPSTHSLKTHTHTLNHLHTRFSLRKRESRQKGRSRRKIHFEERKTKDTSFCHLIFKVGGRLLWLYQVAPVWFQTFKMPYLFNNGF